MSESMRKAIINNISGLNGKKVGKKCYSEINIKEVCDRIEVMLNILAQIKEIEEYQKSSKKLSKK